MVTATNYAPTAQLPPREIQQTHDSSKVIQRVLLIATAGCAILSIIPPLRLAGSLALRGVAMLSATHTFVSTAEQASQLDRLTRCAKVAAVALGFVGLATSLPALFIASLATDVAIHAVEIGKAIHSGHKEQLLFHIGMLAVDTLALSGVICGSWQLMVAAASVSATLLLAAGSICYTTLKADLSEGRIPASNRAWIAVEHLCYLTLMGTMIATAMTTAEHQISKSVATFKGQNETDQPMNFYDKKGQLLQTVQPGESYDFKVDFTALTPTPGHQASRYVSVSTGEKIGTLKLIPDQIDRVNAVSQKPLDSRLFPTLPLGGAAIQNKALDERLRLENSYPFD